MSQALLLTGPPGAGKTTVIRAILERWPGAAGGFFTQEVRGEGGRQGFRLVTLDGREAQLAGIDLPSRERVGRYRVDLRVLETLALEAIETATRAGHLVVIDELGPMELLARQFRMAVIAALDSPAPVLGTIMRGRQPFADTVKARPGVTLVDVRRENQDYVIEQALRWLGSVGPLPQA